MLERPELFRGVIASRYIGNFMPLVQLSSKSSRYQSSFLLPLIVLLRLVGVYSVNSSYVDLYVLALFGILGYGLRGLGYEPAPLVLALVIGPMMETAMRESLIMYQGDVSQMIFRPIAGAIHLLVLAALVLPWFIRRLRGGAAAGQAKGG